MPRSIPGTIEEEGREFVYVEVRYGERVTQLLDKTVALYPDVPLPRSGGIIEEGVRVVLEDGTPLLGMSYQGDLDGWKKRIATFCDKEQRVWGIVNKKRLLLSDGRDVSLFECQVVFE